MADYPIIEGWPNGINTLLSPDALGADTLRNCVNFDIDDTGKIKRRPGRTLAYSGSIQPGSLWSNKNITLFVELGHLKQLGFDLSGNYAASLVRLNVGNRSMHYVDVNGWVYYTNGAITGALDPRGANLDWGVTGPTSQPPAVAGGGGSLAAGKYQIAITFVSASGEESGTPVATEIAVSDAGSIVINALPTPTHADAINIYCSTTDGENLYRVGSARPGVPTYTITNVSNANTRQLTTQFGIAPPACDLLEYHNGRIYMAIGSTVWFTDPLRYGLVMPHRNFFSFPSPVTVMKAVADGLYICADKTYWIAGTDTDQLKQMEVLPYGAVRGTALEIPDSNTVAWFSKRGLVIAGLAGRVANTMEDKVAVSDFDKGASVFHEHDGVRKIIVSLQDGIESNFAASDYVVAETARRGSAI